MAKRRKFTPEFKAELVLEVLICLPTHGCFHPDDQSVATQSALGFPISDAQTDRRGIVPQRP